MRVRDWNHYRFRSSWRLAAPVAEVYAVLERAEEYPSWWPQVRQVRGLDAASGNARFRSVLPYDLTVTARVQRRDREAGVLGIVMTGDLEGWARWTLRDDGTGGGTTALFEQEVEVRKPSLRRVALPGRPLFLANHALMMRSGLRGLRRLLEQGPGDKHFDDG
ncbi:SRPBCC family protein [Streptomyces sp. HNM0574]|uniref:SRPBCC family protein n=1 Tax=Streptomyces sp. HNM0574 TaxID=2714954 RepID=UPI003216C948